MVQRSAIILAAMALGVAPALAVPLTWESNELKARDVAGVAHSDSSNYGPPPPSSSSKPLQRRDVQDDALILSRDLFAREHTAAHNAKVHQAHLKADHQHEVHKEHLKEHQHGKRSVVARDLDGVHLFARENTKAHDDKVHREHVKEHHQAQVHKEHLKEHEHGKRSVVARDFDEDVELVARAHVGSHKPLHLHNQMNSPSGPSSADPSSMAPPARRAVDDYTQLFTRDPGHHHRHHHKQQQQQTSDQGGPPGSAPDPSSMAPPARRAVDHYTQLFTRNFDEDVELFAREPHHRPPAPAADPSGMTRRAVDDYTQLFTRDFDEDGQLFARGHQGGSPNALPPTVPTTDSNSPPGAPLGRRDSNALLFGREIDLD